MCIFLKYLLAFSFLRVSCCISIQGLIKLKYIDDNGTHVLTQYSDQHGGLKGEGIFVRFLRNVLDLLSITFPERKLIRYCRVVGRELDKMEYKYTKQLAKHLRYLSRMYREEIKSTMIEYRQALNRTLKYRTEFLEAMNEVFTLKENLKFSDYVYDLRDYGNEDKLLIDEETRKLLNDVILDAITKLSSRAQRDLVKKMKNALSEFKSENDRYVSK